MVSHAWRGRRDDPSVEFDESFRCRRAPTDNVAKQLREPVTAAGCLGVEAGGHELVSAAALR